MSLKQNYLDNVETLRDIIAIDHFGGEMPDQIVDQWVKALEPGVRVPLPPHVKGFYGGSLEASMPIEVARGSYKYIAHETQDEEKIGKYAHRMLIALSVLDFTALSEKEPNLGALALWHRALAQVRLPERAQELRQTLLQYEELRPRSSLSDTKLPQTGRLKERLSTVAKDIGNEEGLAVLEAWQTK